VVVATAMAALVPDIAVVLPVAAVIGGLLPASFQVTVHTYWPKVPTLPRATVTPPLPDATGMVVNNSSAVLTSAAVESTASSLVGRPS